MWENTELTKNCVMLQQNGVWMCHNPSNWN